MGRIPCDTGQTWSHTGRPHFSRGGLVSPLGSLTSTDRSKRAQQAGGQGAFLGEVLPPQVTRASKSTSMEAGMGGGWRLKTHRLLPLRPLQTSPVSQRKFWASVRQRATMKGQKEETSQMRLKNVLLRK